MPQQMPVAGTGWFVLIVLFFTDFSAENLNNIWPILEFRVILLYFLYFFFLTLVPVQLQDFGIFHIPQN